MAEHGVIVKHGKRVAGTVCEKAEAEVAPAS
jgi:hypothetical protein